MLMRLIRKLHMMITHQHKLLQQPPLPLHKLTQQQHPLLHLLKRRQHQHQHQHQIQLIMHQRLLVQQLTPMSLTQHQQSPKSLSV
jgi:hypothetical protein